MNDSTIGVLICGHGSRDSDAINEFNVLVERLVAHMPDCLVESAFLEFAAPTIRDGLNTLKGRGAHVIICVPGILLAAGHVKNDLPWEINAFSAENPDLDVRYARDLGVDARLIEAVSERITDADNEPKDQTALLVVGRGTTDPDANGNVAKITRILGEGLGFGWAQTCFSGVTTPLVPGVIDQAVRLGYKRVIVMPYFLFTGVLIKRIHGWIETARADYPGVTILEAGYINEHPLLLETLVERVRESLDGGVETNCALCKYRVRVIGHEDELGLPQEGHHHHHVHGHHDHKHGH